MLKNAKIPTKPKPYKNAARPEYKWIVHYPNSDFSAMTYKLFKCKNEASDFIEKITPKCDEDYSTKMLTIDKAREYLQAEELLKPFNTNILTVVKKFISTTQVPIANEQPSDFLTGYLANLKIKSSKAHYTNTQQRLLRFISYLPPKKTLGEISTVDIQKFLDTLCQRRPKKGIRGTYEINKPLINQTAYNGQPIFSAYDNIDFKRYTLKQEQVEQSGIPNILLVSETYGYAPSFVYTSYSSEMYTRYGIEDPSGYLREVGNKTSKYNATTGYCEIGCPTSDKFKVGDFIFIHIDPNYYMGEILYGFTSNFVPIVEIDSVNHKLKVNANDITIRCDENELQYSGTSLRFYDMINDARRGAQTITKNFSSIPKQSKQEQLYPTFRFMNQFQHLTKSFPL